ncbi:MAG: glycosyl hydrolase family 18 protein [Marinisporobacter sp.]|jgi:spore germination protein YaaH|nr:glycosyl hydrolase family 18 protein [Marinisporobacter sp.]
MKNKNIIILLMITFMTVGAMLGILEWKKENPPVDDKVSLIIEDQQIKDRKEPYVDHTGIYLSYDVVKDYLCEPIYLDKNKKRVFMDMKDKEIVLEDEDLSDFVNEKEISINIPIKRIEDTIYVKTDLLSKIFEMDILYNEDSKIVMIDYFSSKAQLGEVVNEDKIKTDSFLGGEKLDLGEMVKVFKEEDEYYKIRNNEGVIGLVKKENIKVFEQSNIDEQLNEKREPFNEDGKKINLVWEYVHEKSKDLSKETKIQSLDVMVPTWFSIINDEGTVINNADDTYVKEAHKKGYKVWGLVNNSFDPKLTSTILNNKSLRKKVIGQLLLYASLYDLDGINIDFENVYYEDQGKLVKFVEEIKYYTKKQNIILSMDITVPSTSKRWSKVYDRKALGNIVDYMAIMTYDEHWASSPVSGSVASIGWVERGIVNTLKSIPEEKVLLGLPFYTRRWKESKNEDGKIKVESKAISMTYAKKIIDEKNAPIIWNEEVGQYYAQYNEDGAIFKIWLEDPRSIALKIGLVEKYDLAGTASWRRGFEDVEVWAVLQEIIKNGRTYAELGFNE